MNALLRAKVIDRDGGKCQAFRLRLSGEFCRNIVDERGRKGHSLIHVHHVWPASQGGTDDLSNLITLCRGHHQRAHQQLRDHFIFAMAAR